MQANFKVVWNDEDKAFISVEDMLNFLRTLHTVSKDSTTPLSLDKVADDLGRILVPEQEYDA